MSCCDKPLRFAQGTTYVQTYRWGTGPLVYKPITARMSTTPLSLTAPAHGLPANWSVAFANIGYVELTADDWPPDADDFYEATVVDSDTVAFNEIDAARLTGAYTPSGSIVYQTPVDLTGISGSFNIYDTSNTQVLTIAAVVDNTAKTITVTISAAQTGGLTVGEFAYAVTATNSGGAVTLLASGALEVFAPGDATCQ